MSNDRPANEDDHQSDDLSQYRQLYVDETEEQLDDLVETMLELEVNPNDESSLASAFRLLHSMKGAAGMMGYDQITALTHHLETRFERLRSGRIELDRVTMNLTLRCIDFLKECNDRLRDDQELATPDELLQELRELEESTENQLEADVDKVSESPSKNDQAVVEQALDEGIESSASQTDRHSVGTEVASDHSTGEATNQSSAPKEVTLGTHFHVIAHIDPAVTLKEINARAVASALDEIAEVKATRPEIEELDDCEDLSVFDVIVFTELSPNQILQVALVDGIADIEVRTPHDSESPPLATTRHGSPANDDGKTYSAGSHSQGSEASSPQTNLHDARASQQSSRQDAADQGQVAKSRRSSPIVAQTKQSETMRVDIDRLDNLMSLAGELVVNRAQFVQVANDLGVGLRKSSANNTTRQLHDTLTRAIERLRSEEMSRGANWIAPIHELEAGLGLLSEHQSLVEESRRNFGRLDEAIDQLSRVSNSLQRGVLGTRMVPVAPLFNRFKRVVRDLSLDRGKQIVLELDGENTELDKRMIDALGDPLVHLVRNSVDHGMESPEVRLAAGKTSEGKVTLSAQHRGNHVYIQIQDDGGGIDDDRIRGRLVERGILNATEAANLSRQDAVDYIWHPGFSTADTVTDVSGRGVGMDIVKASIAGLGGSIETESEIGIGTTFTLKLPLTLAIISSLLVEIRKIVFAIPKDDVREIVQVRTDEIIAIGDRQAFEVRGKYLPLISVDDVFDWNNNQSDAGSLDQGELPSDDICEVVILQSVDRAMGLKVNRSIGSQDVVIKSLSENYVSIRGLAGASILGNGSVALMLDVATLFKIEIAIH